MGNIQIKSIPKQPQQRPEYAYADLHLDLLLQYTDTNDAAAVDEKRDAAVDYDLQAIRNSIRAIFLTTPGEKILNPLFGADMRDFLFMPINDTTSNLIRERITTSIKIFEPRVRLVSNPVILPSPDAKTYSVEMVVAVPGLNNSEIHLIGVLNNDGYVTFE
tara:strand:- start:31841 stop:32323 length:483 start_codon:yes stop_codon:yes gene_type:complete